MASQHGSGGALGIKRIVLASLMAQLAVGAIDVHNRVAVLGQEPGQTGTVRSCSLDAERPYEPGEAVMRARLPIRRPDA